MKRWLIGLVGVLGLGVVLSAQGTLSQQVLQLLARTNAWIGTNTFYDFRIPLATVPSDTSQRIYSDLAGNLYYSGVVIVGAGGSLPPHALLGVSHVDTLSASVTRGAVIVGNATPAWSKLSLCTSGFVLESNGTDTICSSSGAALTALTAANLTGTAAAIDGNAITNLNATNLGTGTVPLARLSNIANAQIAAAAGIVYSKLSLAASILNADIAGGAAIAYSKLALTGSIVNADHVAASLLFDRWASNGCTSGQVPQYTGAAWACRTLTTTDVTGAGTVSSVALTAPSIFSVAGSPITTSGTLAVSLATQTANVVWAGPSGGGAVAPTFRALVNADFPLSGVAAASYAKVTVNTAGIVTAASAQASLTTDVSGVLPFANGGTGVSLAADDTVLIGSGAAWVAQSLPNCTTGALNYATATNLFSCNSSTLVAHNILSSTHTDTLTATVVRGDMMIGNTTPVWSRIAVGTIGQLWSNNGTDPSWVNTIARGTITASTPWSFTQTWNSGGVTFTALSVNVTDTASSGGSLLLDLQKAGVSQLYVDKTGNVTSTGTFTGSGANLTNLDNALTKTDTGTQNNYAITVTGNLTTVLFNNASATTITGVALTPVQYAGRRIRFINIGSSTVQFNNQDTNSLAANRIITGITGNLIITAGGSFDLTYDASSTWRVQNFDQGGWITPAFNGGHFTGGGVMTWTVDAGDVATVAYWLKGKTLTVQIFITLSTLGGTTDQFVQISNGQWGGFTATKQMTGNAVVGASGGAITAGFARIDAAATQLKVFRSDGASWLVSGANNTTVVGAISFEVQ